MQRVVAVLAVFAVAALAAPTGPGKAEDTKAMACEECATHKDYLDAKDEEEDRIITDRRSWNACQRSLGRVDLPKASRYGRIVRAPNQVCVLHLRDLRHHFHQMAVPKSKLPSQGVGPRVPWS